MKVHEIFPTYVFEFDYPDHDKYKDEWIDRIRSKTDYYEPHRMREMLNGTQKTLVTGHPDLYKEPIFFPIRDFLKECVSKAMGDLGFQESCTITSMWSNYQFKGGFNHTHHHYNTYLVGIYYLYASGSGAKGTKFLHPDWTKHSIIMPPINYMKNQKIQPDYMTEFKPGKCLVFPGFMRHSTLPNPEEERMMLGINTMPLGQTNCDPWDRYNYTPQE